MKGFAWAVIMLASAAAAAPGGQRFDLACTGTSKFDLLEAGRPTSFILHVDLAARRWCEDSCPAIMPIADVQPAFIAFESPSSEQTALRQQNSRVVSRDDGKYLQYVNDHHGTVIAVDAQCERRDFSGFPERVTKF